MSSLSAISLSGMNAAQAAMGSAAHNIANLETAGFRRQEVEQATTSGGGVGTTFSRAAAPGNAPLTDLVDMLTAKDAFLANLAVFRSSDRMAGTLLDATS
jgi:flagellar hook protein FlgE